LCARQALKDTIGIVNPVLYGAGAHGLGQGPQESEEEEDTEEIELLFGKHPPDHAPDSPDEELFKSP
jgi:hypothetical protein